MLIRILTIALLALSSCDSVHCFRVSLEEFDDPDIFHRFHYYSDSYHLMERVPVQSSSEEFAHEYQYCSVTAAVSQVLIVRGKQGRQLTHFKRNDQTWFGCACQSVAVPLQRSHSTFPFENGPAIRITFSRGQLEKLFGHDCGPIGIEEVTRLRNGTSLGSHQRHPPNKILE